MNEVVRALVETRLAASGDGYGTLETGQAPSLPGGRFLANPAW